MVSPNEVPKICDLTLEQLKMTTPLVYTQKKMTKSDSTGYKNIRAKVGLPSGTESGLEHS